MLSVTWIIFYVYVNRWPSAILKVSAICKQCVKSKFVGAVFEMFSHRVHFITAFAILNYNIRIWSCIKGVNFERTNANTTKSHKNL